MTLFTIGFTQSSAEHFFGRLTGAGVQRVIDIRLNNTSQLAGFAKAQDLPYFLEALGGIGYLHEPLLAPTQDMIDGYRKRKEGWEAFATRFLALMEERRIDQRLDPALFDGGCLLCSEAKPHRCHRSLVAGFLNDRWDRPVEVRHL